MHKKESVLQNLLSQQLLPLFYHDAENTSVRVLHALYAAGIRLVEYTNRGDAAPANFAAMRRYADRELPGMQLGIGTIKTTAQARTYLDAGADFIVCPTVNADVAAVTADAGLLWIPGCMTPTEIATAEAAGASLVKIFPGNILGPGYITAIKELFPGLKFMPTGGVEVTEANLSGWFKSGVVAVGMGSKLITKELIASGDYNTLEKDAAAALQLVQQTAAQ